MTRKQVGSGISYSPLESNHYNTNIIPKFVQSPQDFFLDIGLTILYTPLEWVKSKTWIQREDCHIFIIGETHHPRNHKCQGIYEMFVDIINKIQRSEVKPNIDIMLEITENQVERMKDTKRLIKVTRQYSSHFVLPPSYLNKKAEELLEYRRTRSIKQIDMVRHLFANCIKYKQSFTECPVKIHWSDSNDMYVNGRIPKWLVDLDQAQLTETDWTKNPDISSHLQSREDFMNLLTKHTIVTKEIERAEKVDPTFNMSSAKKMFKDMIEFQWQYNLRDKRATVFYLFRAVMDFYTVARIIKSKMKHVIVYVGDGHAERIIDILQKLRFQVLDRTTNPECN